MVINSFIDLEYQDARAFGVEYAQNGILMITHVTNPSTPVGCPTATLLEQTQHYTFTVAIRFAYLPHNFAARRIEAGLTRTYVVRFRSVLLSR
jgi:hypothetical protein